MLITPHTTSRWHKGPNGFYHGLGKESGSVIEPSFSKPSISDPSLQEVVAYLKHKAFPFQRPQEKGLDINHISMFALTEPIGVVDIGSRTAKVLIAVPERGIVFSKPYLLELGDSLGRHGYLSDRAQHSLMQALEQIGIVLKKHGISEENTFACATAGLRDAPGDDQEKMLQEAHKKGIPLRVLEPMKEAELVYKSVLRNVPLHSFDKAIVLEIGGGSTELAFGYGQRDFDPALSDIIPMGSSRLNLADPFDVDAIAQASQKCRQLLSQNPALAGAALGRQIYMGKSIQYRLLRKLHTVMTGEDLFQQGKVTKTCIERYLSPPVLEQLRKLSTQSEWAELKLLPSKLILLKEVMTVLGCDTVFWGADGGMKAGILEEAIQAQYRRKAMGWSEEVHDHLKQQFNEVMDQVHGMIPSHFGTISARYKSASSIYSKLLKAVIESPAGFHRPTPRNSEEARCLIRDGIGLQLVLCDSRQKGCAGVNAVTQQVVDNLVKAMNQGTIQITEIENYHGQDGLPYLSDQQIKQLEVVARKHGKTITVLSGKAAQKPSGYTTAQMNVVFQNGALGEIQIRGPHVQEFFEIEHLIYDLRMGKPIFTTKPKASALLAPIKEAFQEVSRSAELTQHYNRYLSGYYTYARKRELGDPSATVPEFHPTLPESLKVERIASIYHTIQALLKPQG